jgi:hypothetical protein
MRAFRISLNGKRLCVAGVGETGVLSTIVSYVNGARAHSLDVSVGGLFTPSGEHAEWKRVNLKVGDSVGVTVIETESVDKPKKRYPRPDSKIAEKNEKAYVRAKAMKFGWQIVTRPKKSK